MEFLDSFPYLFRIIISLFAILVFQKLTKRLDVAMIAGILLLGLWTDHSMADILAVAGGRIASLDTLFLAMVITCVIWLSGLMSHAGIMRDLVVSLKARLSKRTILAALPAVVGLLPMPGGALFSCPLLDDADEGGAIDPITKTKINYWFRHAWEFGWPLYPGVLLAVDLSGLPIWKLVLLMCPMFVVAIAAGYYCMLRRMPGGGHDGNGERKPFFQLILPIITVIVVYSLIMVAAPQVGRYNKYLPMFIGVLCALAVMQAQRPASLGTWRKTVFSTRWIALVAIIVLARVYGAFIESRLANGEMLMERVRAELDTFGIPSLLLIVLIPFISGLTTGITIGYIGASFPVVLSLAAGASTGGYFAAIILGYTCGYIGMMLSPIHVCLIVTNQYFKTSLTGSVLGLLKPSLILFAAAAVYALAWWALF